MKLRRDVDASRGSADGVGPGRRTSAHPVPDGGGRHSVFNRELPGVLCENQGVLHGAQLFNRIRERVQFTVDGDAVRRTPISGSIECAGHESGQSGFVHSKSRA